MRMPLSLPNFLSSLEVSYNELRELFTDQFLSKGSYFAREGEIVDHIAWIETGYLRAFQLDYHGKDTTLEFFHPHSFCGSYYGFYARKPALDSLVAITDVHLATIHFSALEQLYLDHPNLNLLGRKLVEQVCIRKELRISRLLQLDAAGRYKWFTDTYPELLQIARLQDIASFLGMKAETLSRIRKLTS